MSAVLVKYDQARFALQAAATVDEAKQIHDQARALKVYARQRKDSELHTWVAEIQLRAVMRIGEISGGLDASRERDSAGHLIATTGKQAKAAVLKAAGLSTSVAHRAEGLFAHAAEVETYIARKTQAKKPVKVTEALRLIKRRQVQAKAVALPRGQYRVIYADPPWKYNDSRTGTEGRETTAAEENYPTMALSELEALGVADLAAPDSVLWLWATFPLLPEALHLTKAWGFTYKTAFVWDKVRGTFGHYHNACAELLLLATRGSAVPDIDKRVPQVQCWPRAEHSRKPDEARALIDSLYTVGARIELFRRGEAPPGWVVWGNEVREAA